MTQPSTTDLIISRIFYAPRELVYQAFTDADQLAQWFGPVGYSVPRDTVQIDARAGGYQRFVMLNDANPAERSAVDATFTEVIENELLVGYQDVVGIPGTEGIVRFMLRVELHDEGDGKTRLELRQGPHSAEMESNARLGWESSFAKLDALLKGA
jgi:uncharacterized protein YndB with AHSA1/START domain